jgi:methionyl-tRNA formyltransferase
VSIQTLHPTQFDRGEVLAQTPAPGIEIVEGMTAGELEAELAIKGADMLVHVLKTGTYSISSENENAGTWYTGPIAHAPKLTKQDRYLSFAEHDLEHILAIQRALGDMWCVLPNGERLIIHGVASVEDDGNTVVEKQEPGLWASQGSACLLFKAKCGRVGRVVESTYAGGKKGQGNAKVMRMLLVVAR